MSKEETISESTLFVDGAARFKDLIYIVARDRGLQEEAVEHSRFIAFYQQNFCHNGDRNWSGIAVCVVKRPTEKMVSVGEDGEVLTYVGGTVTEEQIVPEPMAIHNLGVIDGLAYACGMDRQVFRRDDENSWTAMHAPRSASEAGFEAIDGFSADEIYTVGWNGEIFSVGWQRLEQSQRSDQCDSDGGLLWGRRYCLRLWTAGDSALRSRQYLATAGPGTDGGGLLGCSLVPGEAVPCHRIRSLDAGRRCFDTSRFRRRCIVVVQSAQLGRRHLVVGWGRRCLLL